LRSLTARQQKQIEALTATVRKVSERVELSAPAPQISQRGLRPVWIQARLVLPVPLMSAVVLQIKGDHGYRQFEITMKTVLE
jgi:hypothetical protein